MNDVLPDKVMKVHQALDAGGIPHAIGGAIALTYCGEPRYTKDIDINIALPPDRFRPVFDIFAELFPIEDENRSIDRVLKTSQVTLHWAGTPIDLFFANVPFHESIAQRTHDVNYMNIVIPVVSCEDLIVLKAAFNRPKDWPDITSIFEIQRDRIDVAYVRRWIAEFYAPGDGPFEQIERLIRQYVEPDEAQPEP